MNACDVAMVDSRGGSRLALESAERCNIAERRTHHYFRCYPSLQPQVGRFIHDAKAPATQRSLEPILSVKRPLNWQRKHQLSAIVLTTSRSAVVAGAALRTFLQQTDP